MPKRSIIKTSVPKDGVKYRLFRKEDALYFLAQAAEAFLAAPQTGQRQSSGRSSNLVPAGILCRLSPRSGSHIAAINHLTTPDIMGSTIGLRLYSASAPFTKPLDGPMSRKRTRDFGQEGVAQRLDMVGGVFVVVQMDLLFVDDPLKQAGGHVVAFFLTDLDELIIRLNNCCPQGLRRLHR